MCVFSLCCAVCVCRWRACLIGTAAARWADETCSFFVSCFFFFFGPRSLSRTVLFVKLLAQPVEGKRQQTRGWMHREPFLKGRNGHRVACSASVRF